jgi:hypothetical protein
MDLDSQLSVQSGQRELNPLREESAKKKRRERLNNRDRQKSSKKSLNLNQSRLNSESDDDSRQYI